MFAKNISRVDITPNEVEVNHPRCNSFVDLVEGEHDMSFGNLGIRCGRTINKRIFIGKQVAVIIDRATQVVQGGLVHVLTFQIQK